MTRPLFAAGLAALCIAAPFSRSVAQETSAISPPPVERRLGALDRLPPDYLEVAAELRNRDKAALARAMERNRRRGVAAVMARPRLVWGKQVVTVAFNGGDDRMRGLIESTAHEWTSIGDRFRLDFRDTQGAFRTWSAADTAPAADIRISFRTGSDGGYWSLIGRMATTARPNRPTMNFEYFDEDTRTYAGATDALWLESYLHSTVLHEFGHALGLAHEHFHVNCQSDIKFDPDAGYIATYDASGALSPDPEGRSPGANFYLLGPPNGWSLTEAQFNLSATKYVEVTRQSESKYFAPPREGGRFFDASQLIDRRSVMMYVIEPFLLKSGVNSPCIGQGDGVLSSGLRYATRLSDGDTLFFRRTYMRPNWRPSGP